jgi:hypothetical protein
VSKDAADIPGLLIGEVGIKDYGEKGNNVVFALKKFPYVFFTFSFNTYIK